MFVGPRVNIQPTDSEKQKKSDSPSWKSQKNMAMPLQNHTELDNLCIINEATMEREMPNGDPIIVDNELMNGVMLPMIRTTDADDQANVEPVLGSESNTKVSNYLRPKKRRFELQLQFKLKHVPEGQLFFGCELDETLDLGLVQRTFLSAIMSFIQKKNNGLFFNLCGEEKEEGDGYEKPHFSLYFETCADRFVITKPEEEPPELGGDIYENPKITSRRKTGEETIKYNTEDTYTVAVWSAYVDFAQWKCLNIPAISQFNLSSVIGNQIFRIHWYLADPTLLSHRQKDIKRILSYEFGHTVESKVGPSARIYLEKLRLNNALAIGHAPSIEEIGSVEEAKESIIGGLFSYLSLYK